MKRTEHYLLREIAGESILVPVGEKSKEVNAFITLNEMGTFIYNHVDECKTFDDMVSIISSTYEGDIEKIKQDTYQFLQIFLEADMITLD